MAKRNRKMEIVPKTEPRYDELLSGISDLLERARRMSARSVNSILTATYWEVGRRIVEFEQGGKARAEYGEELMKRLGQDLAARHGRGFSPQGLYKMRGFYLGWQIFPTASGKLQARAIFPTLSGESGGDAAQAEPGQSALVPAGCQPLDLTAVAMTEVFPLSWSHYVRLIAVTTARARVFYEAEAIRGGWSVRQLDRQIGTQFYERTSHSKRQAVMLAKGRKPKPEDTVTAQDEVRDPYLLEFLNLKDEYSETDLEEALIRHLEWFLLELGAGFAFVTISGNGQRRPR
jgi:predicted nuclease of restriction endonuclease-like (RecB) superfamily